MAERDSSPPRAFADRVMDYRAREAISQAELARRLGVDQSRVSQLESGGVPSRPLLLLFGHIESGRLTFEGEVRRYDFLGDGA